MATGGTRARLQWFQAAASSPESHDSSIIVRDQGRRMTHLQDDASALRAGADSQTKQVDGLKLCALEARSPPYAARPLPGELVMSRAVRYLVCTLATALLVRPASAQSPAPDSIIGSPRWAVEAPIGAGYTASLLRFGRGASAWVLGLEWNGGAQSGTVISTPTGSTGDEASFFDASLSIGRRRYRGTGALRPFLGLGLTASAGSRSTAESDDDRWSAGAYGEMGAAYFLNRHVSLGGLGSVSVLRSENTYVQSFTPQAPRIERRSWFTTGPNLRLIASVYF
jgi:hypothetical protein